MFLGGTKSSKLGDVIWIWFSYGDATVTESCITEPNLNFIYNDYKHLI